MQPEVTRQNVDQGIVPTCAPFSKAANAQGHVHQWFIAGLHAVYPQLKLFREMRGLGLLISGERNVHYRDKVRSIGLAAA